MPAPAGARRILPGGGKGISFRMLTRPATEGIGHPQPTIPLRGSLTGG